jgi:hypothetical protein
MIATAFGIALGIPAGLLIDRANKRRAEAEERVELVAALKAVIGKNRTLNEQLKQEMQGYVWNPHYSYDVSLLEQTAYRKFELGLGAACCEKRLN